jgi:hypothetical protein
MLAGDSCHMPHLKGGGPVSAKPRQSPTFFANFRELRKGEVRRMILLGTSVNKGIKRAGLLCPAPRPF